MSTTTTRQTAEERREAVLDGRGARVLPQGPPRRLDRRDREGRRHLAALPLPALRDEEGAVPRHDRRRRWRRPTRPSSAPRAARAARRRCTRWARRTRGLIEDRERLQLMLQCFAGCEDAEVRESVRRVWRDLVDLVERASGEPPEVISAFFAKGMLLNVHERDAALRRSDALGRSPDRRLRAQTEIVFFCLRKKVTTYSRREQ